MKVLTLHQFIKDLHIKAMLMLYVISVKQEPMKDRCFVLFNIPKVPFERSLFRQSPSLNCPLANERQQ